MEFKRLGKYKNCLWGIKKWYLKWKKKKIINFLLFVEKKNCKKKNKIMKIFFVENICCLLYICILLKKHTAILTENKNSN